MSAGVGAAPADAFALAGLTDAEALVHGAVAVVVTLVAGLLTDGALGAPGVRRATQRATVPALAEDAPLRPVAPTVEEERELWAWYESRGFP